jgi:hypothetical protein
LAVSYLLLAVLALYAGECIQRFARFRRKEIAMSYKLFYWLIGLMVLIFALAAYNIPAEGAPLHDGAQTAAASTLLALVTPQNTVTALSSPTGVLPSSTPTSHPTDTPAPAYSVPMLTLRDATNCRTGPGLAYEIIVTYPISQTLEILGRYEPGNFWLVKSGESPTGACWLWGEFADVTGSTWAVASVTPPPTPIASPTLRPSAPQPPSLQAFRYYCNDIDHTFSFEMSWDDRAGNEAGYRIFRDGWLVVELPAGSTAYGETISMPTNRSAEYSVQAYNAVGSAGMSVKKLTCDE